MPNPLALDRWISQLWEPLAAYGGRLNPDPLDAVAVVLHRRDAVPGDLSLPVGSRGLAIFALKPNGSYVRRVLAERMLPCVQCLGTLNRDPAAVPFDIDFIDGKLSVGWIGNADGLLAVRLTIAWDAQREAYALVADDVARSDPLTGIQTRRIRDFVSGRQIENGETIAIVRRFIPLESVSADDYR